MAEGRKKNSKTGVLMSMNFGGINQSSATGPRPYVSRPYVSLYLEDTLTSEQRREKTLQAIKDFLNM